MWPLKKGDACVGDPDSPSVFMDNLRPWPEWALAAAFVIGLFVIGLWGAGDFQYKGSWALSDGESWRRRMEDFFFMCQNSAKSKRLWLSKVSKN